MSKPNPMAVRVLRVAVVVDDKVCAELHQSEPASLSVGTSYHSDLLVHGARVPERHPVFDFVRREGAFYLDLPAEAAGKVKIGGRALPVRALRERYGRGDKLRVRLPPQAKGKLRFGETTVLFQLTRPKPVAPRLPFPAIFRVSIVGMLGAAFLYCQLASVSLLGPFFAWASLADLPEEVEPDERWLALVGAPPIDRDEPPEEEEDLTDELAEEDEILEKEPEPKPTEPVRLAEKPQQYSKEAMSEARSVGVARVLGTYGGPGEGSVFDVIQSTENNLGELFAQGMSTTVLADGGPIGEFVPGGEGIALRGSALGTAGFETDGPDLSNKAEKRERKIEGRIQTTRTDVSGGGDAKALRATIKHRTSALQHCYNKALRTQPDLTGKITYTIVISVMGTVTRVVLEEDSVGSSAVAECTKLKIRGWRFPMNGEEEEAELTFSVVFSGA